MILLFLSPALLLFGMLAYLRYNSAVILLAGLLPTYLLRFPLAGVPTNFFEMAVVVVFLSGFFKVSVRNQRRNSLKRLPPLFVLWIIIFMLTAVVSTIISPEIRVSLGILKGWFLIPLIFAFIVSSGSNTEEIRSKIVHSLLISGVVVSLLAFFQIGHVARLQSIYDTPNSLALFVAPLFVIAAWQLITNVEHKIRSWLVVVVLGMTLLGTQSISSVVAVTIALGIGCLLWISPEQRSEALRYGLVSWLLIFIVIGASGKLSYIARPFIDPTSHSSLSVRFQLWAVATDLIRENPLLGIGLGQFEPAYQQKLHEQFILAAGNPEISQPLPEFVYRDPHNFILSFWLNLGLLGVISFFAIHYIVFKFANTNNNTSQGVLLALIAILVFGLTDTIYWKNDLSALQWLLIFLARDLWGLLSQK